MKADVIVNGVAIVDSQTLDTISPPPAEMPALRLASPSLADVVPAIRTEMQFDIHSRLRGAMDQYEKGKALLAEVEEEMKRALTGFNEQRATLAKGLIHLEGIIEILNEQGARVGDGEKA